MPIAHDTKHSDREARQAMLRRAASAGPRHHPDSRKKGEEWREERGRRNDIGYENTASATVGVRFSHRWSLLKRDRSRQLTFSPALWPIRWSSIEERADIKI